MESVHRLPVGRLSPFVLLFILCCSVAAQPFPSTFPLPDAQDFGAPVPDPQPLPSSAPSPSATPVTSVLPEVLQPLSATPPPSRPPRVFPVDVLGAPMGSYVLLNVSWSLPPPFAPGAPFLPFNPFRADLDVAVRFPGNSSASFAGTPAGCQATYRNPSFAIYSSDDTFAPGWEALWLSVDPNSPFFKLSQDIEVSAAWYGSVFPLSQIEASATLVVNGTVLQKETVQIGSSRRKTRNCPVFSPKNLIATFRPLSLSSAPHFSFFKSVPADAMELPDNFFSPEPTFEIPDVSETPEDGLDASEPEPSAVPGNVLSIIFEWSNRITDVESAIFLTLNDSAVGASCLSAAPFVRFFGNSFSTSGEERFEVRLDEARDTGKFDQALPVFLAAAWYGSRYVRPSEGNASVRAYVTSVDGTRYADTGRITVFPFVGRSCPSSFVGIVLVEHSNGCDGLDTPAYKLSVQANGPPDLSSLPIPSATEDDDAVESPQATDSEEFPSVTSEAESFVPFISEPSAEPELEGSPEELAFEGEGLRISFSWPSNEDDLDTGVRIADQAAGLQCPSYGNIISFSGDETRPGGSERYLVSLAKARAQGMWRGLVDIELYAAWFSRTEYAFGDIRLDVWYEDESGTVSGLQTVFVNPVVEGSGDDGIHDFLGGCGPSKIGRVRIEEDSNGTISTKLLIVARDGNFFE